MPATTFTTKLVLRKPDPDPTTGDLINVVTDINQSMDKIDSAMGFTVCTSGTRPIGADRWDGRQIYETDTRRTHFWSSTLGVWIPLLNGRTAAIGPYLLGPSTDTTGEGINGESSGSGVSMWRTRTTGDANPRFTIDSSGKQLWGGGAAPGDVEVSRIAANVLGTATGDAFQVSGDYVCGSENGISQAATTSGTNVTTSSVYVNLAGTGSVTSFSFIKRFAATRIRIDISATFYTTDASAGARFGVLINGVDYDVCQLAGNVSAANTHLHASGFAYVPAGVAAGTYTVQGRWKRIVGVTGNLTRDTNDWLAISTRECN